MCLHGLVVKAVNPCEREGRVDAAELERFERRRSWPTECYRRPRIADVTDALSCSSAR